MIPVLTKLIVKVLLVQEITAKVQMTNLRIAKEAMIYITDLEILIVEKDRIICQAVAKVLT